MQNEAKSLCIKKTEPLPVAQVQINNGFWGERLRINREMTLPIEYKNCKKTGRIDAFKLNWKPGKTNKPHVFWDSDLAKWIEAASFSILTDPDPNLKKKLDRIINLVASAQQEDGYLNTHFTVVEPGKRWTNLRDDHELYCAGHLMEAAVAHYEATGEKTLLNALCSYADYIGSVFGRGRGKKRGYPGHEEIELALVKLYRATGKLEYLKLAQYFVDERGRQPRYFNKESKERGERAIRRRDSYESCQAHLPVRQQTSAEGHAVRAAYLYAGMADVAAETGDKELLAACRKLWKNITEKRMYIHGGIGSSPRGEQFTVDYDLPNEEAYAETCASIALVFFAHRMLQIEPDRKYSDVIERALYNGIISGVSLDGTCFFYDNLLASVPGTHRFRGQRGPGRQAWFGCACCPPNLARILASLGQYVYSRTPKSVYIHLFADSEAKLKINGKQLTLKQKTNYPWDEKVTITLSVPEALQFTAAIRIPGWCRAPEVKLNGKHLNITGNLKKGYLKIMRTWNNGDKVQLRLPMPVEKIEAHPAVRQNCGRIALQRGPVVYCLEEKDNGKNLHDVMITESSSLTVKKEKKGIFKGIPLIRFNGLHRDVSEWRGSLYEARQSSIKKCKITAVPYFMWANRGTGEMLVWIESAQDGHVRRQKGGKSTICRK